MFQREPVNVHDEDLTSAVVVVVAMPSSLPTGHSSPLLVLVPVRNRLVVELPVSRPSEVEGQLEPWDLVATIRGMDVLSQCNMRAGHSRCGSSLHSRCRRPRRRS